MPELINGERKVWNPLARYYVEPAGEWIAEKLVGTKITPNMISILNTIVGLLASLLIYVGGTLNYILFGIWVRFYHMFDVTDGHLARTANLKSKYGGFIDGVGDRLVMGVWPAMIIYVLFRDSRDPKWLLLGGVFIFGLYMYMVGASKADKHFGEEVKKDSMKKKMKSSLFSQVFLFFIDGDIQYHFLTFAAIFNRFDIYIWFYAIYFNLVWIVYVAYYSYRHMRGIK